MIPKSDWKWFGSAAHLIVGNECRFHLATQVGPWLVSTVGEWVPDESVREIFARSNGVTLEGIGDARLADYMRKVGFKEIGYERTYETMVFRLGPKPEECSCGCGLPKPAEYAELDTNGYNDAKSATAGHLAMCETWAATPDVREEARKELERRELEGC